MHSHPIYSKYTGDDSLIYERDNCQNTSKKCKCQNFLLLAGHEFIEWLIHYKKSEGLTNAGLSGRTNVPVGTLNRILADPHADFRYETAHQIMLGITQHGLDAEEYPDSETDMLRARVQHLEQELADTKAMAATATEEHNRVVTYLKSQVRNHRTALIVTALLLVAVLLGIIGVLVYDITHPGIGYFGL